MKLVQFTDAETRVRRADCEVILGLLEGRCPNPHVVQGSTVVLYLSLPVEVNGIYVTVLHM